MSELKVFGLLEFSQPILCSSDVLGKTVDISISNCQGTMTFPSLPEWQTNEKDPLNKILLGPEPARTWKRGDCLICWGQPISYPDGDSDVEFALLEFTLNTMDFESKIQEIYELFPLWLRLFEQYVLLLTTQRTRSHISGGDGSGRLEIYQDNDSKLNFISHNAPQYITIELSDLNETLHINQLCEAALLSSRRLQPRLQYKMLIEAYNARKNNDYRKVIIDCATAIEVGLIERIRNEFDSLGIPFGEKLLQKFRMLSGLFELTKIMGIKLPEKDYKTLIIKPRNDVIHRAAFPTSEIVNQMIGEVEGLLKLLSPQLSEDFCDHIIH